MWSCEVFLPDALLQRLCPVYTCCCGCKYWRISPCILSLLSWHCVPFCLLWCQLMAACLFWAVNMYNDLCHWSCIGKCIFLGSIVMLVIFCYSCCEFEHLFLVAFVLHCFLVLILLSVAHPLCRVFSSAAVVETLNPAFLLQFDVVLSCHLSPLLFICVAKLSNDFL